VNAELAHNGPGASSERALVYKCHMHVGVSIAVAGLRVWQLALVLVCQGPLSSRCSQAVHRHILRQNQGSFLEAAADEEGECSDAVVEARPMGCCS
jgi:hypothetical protein